MTANQLKSEISRQWDIYNTSDDSNKADAAYWEWCRLVADLEVLSRDRTTRKWTKG